MQHINKHMDRIIQLEKTILGIPEYNKLFSDKKLTLEHLKQKSENITWEEFDDFLCADNAHCSFIMSFFYNQGYSDGNKN